MQLIMSKIAMGCHLSLRVFFLTSAGLARQSIENLWVLQIRLSENTCRKPHSFRERVISYFLHRPPNHLNMCQLPQ